MSLEDLPITEFESRASKFFKQPTDDMCYSCGITNALNDLGRKINNPSFKFSLNEINRLCGYKEGFACRDEIVPTVINSRLSRFGYNWTESMGAVNKIDQIKKQCEQEKLSLPLVNVSSEYFDYKRSD